MNFEVFKTSNKLDVKKITKKNSSFWIRRNQKSETELFHINKISTNLFHSVFFISNHNELENQTKSAQETSLFNQYVNTFIFPDKGFIFIEFINNPYVDSVIKEYEKIFKTDLTKFNFNNSDFKKINTSLDATISEVEYTDTNLNEDFYFETKNEIKKNLPFMFSETNNISYLLFNINNNYLSFKNNQILSIGNDDEEFLITVCEDIIHAIL